MLLNFLDKCVVYYHKIAEDRHLYGSKESREQISDQSISDPVFQSMFFKDKCGLARKGEIRKGSLFSPNTTKKWRDLVRKGRANQRIPFSYFSLNFSTKYSIQMSDLARKYMSLYKRMI